MKNEYMPLRNGDIIEADDEFETGKDGWWKVTDQFIPLTLGLPFDDRVMRPHRRKIVNINLDFQG